LATNSLRVLLTLYLDACGLAVEVAKVHDRESHPHDDPERGERWGDQEGDDKAHEARNDGREYGAAQEPRQRSGGEVFEHGL
jgi:hypothetical protein